MRLRRLELKDAPLMLEWMHDDSVVHNLATDFASKTLEDCENFIKKSRLDEKVDLHRAIVDGQDTYMGTVSLKHIQSDLSYAEFAITVRKSAMGKGYAQYAMREMIRIATKELSINNIYWCVNKENHRAIKFYEKMSYMKTNDIPIYLKGEYIEKAINLIWFASDIEE